MSFTLPGVFRLENNKNNLEKKNLSSLFPPIFAVCICHWPSWLQTKQKLYSLFVAIASMGG